MQTGSDSREHEHGYEGMRMISRLNFSNVAAYCVLSLLITGCATFRYSVSPQESRGPHGGALALIDQRVPDYVEFVATPSKKDWIFQVFVYDKNLQQRDICGSGYLTVELPDGTKKAVELWNTKPFFWSRGKGHLENKLLLNDAREFLAKVSVQRGRRTDRLLFKYP